MSARLFLVTGGAGFIGSHIATALAERGDSVRVLDNLSTGFTKNLDHLSGQVDLIEGDILDEAVVAKAMAGVDCVFHQAALASVPRSIADPLASHAACVTGTLNILNEARKAGVRRVVYAASSSAYGDLPYSSKREIDLPRPLSPYAAAKLAGEFYCQAMASSFGLQTVAIRYFNVFGPRQDPGSPYSAVIPLFIAALLKGQQPTIYGDGGQTRDFTYVANVVHGNLLAADADAANVSGKVFNIANGRSVGLMEMLDHLNRLLGTQIQPKFEPARVGDVRDSLADISSAQALLGYESQVSFEEGLKHSIAFYQALVGGK